MAKTIYTVEGVPSGESSQPSDLLSGPVPVGRRAAGLSAAQVAPKTKRRKLFWVLLVIAILTVVMIAVIAALGTSESPAIGTTADLMSSSTVTYVPTTNAEPVGTSTTVGAGVEASGSTGPSSTTTTVFTHSILDPVRVVIPVIKVDAPIVAVGLTNGTDMEVPAVGIVGWYKLGAAPGASRPSVLVSHVSWNGQKGAFYRLKDLKPGDEVQVYDASGDCAVFLVDWSETVLKTSLPTQRIWNHTHEAVIRLVTCGGTYDPTTDHYLSNVIVYGHLVK